MLVQISTQVVAGHGRTMQDAAEEAMARRLVVKKYYHRDQVESSGWEAKALLAA